MRDYKQLLDERMEIQHKLRYRAKIMEMAFDMATEFLGELFSPGALLGSVNASQKEWRENFLKAAEKELSEREHAEDTQTTTQDDLTSVSNKYQKNT